MIMYYSERRSVFSITPFVDVIAIKLHNLEWTLLVELNLVSFNGTNLD